MAILIMVDLYGVAVSATIPLIDRATEDIVMQITVPAKPGPELLSRVAALKKNSCIAIDDYTQQDVEFLKTKIVAGNRILTKQEAYFMPVLDICKEKNIRVITLINPQQQIVAAGLVTEYEHLTKNLQSAHDVAREQGYSPEDPEVKEVIDEVERQQHIIASKIGYCTVVMRANYALKMIKTWDPAMAIMRSEQANTVHWRDPAAFSRFQEEIFPVRELYQFATAAHKSFLSAAELQKYCEAAVIPNALERRRSKGTDQTGYAAVMRSYKAVNGQRITDGTPELIGDFGWPELPVEIYFEGRIGNAYRVRYEYTDGSDFGTMVITSDTIEGRRRIGGGRTVVLTGRRRGNEYQGVYFLPKKNGESPVRGEFRLRPFSS